MILGHWQLRGFGFWAVEERATGTLLGRIGFFKPEGWPDFELGWMLRREAWGRGYATEGARRAMAHAFTAMDRDHVISLIFPGNDPSIRVAERLGETLERRPSCLATPRWSTASRARLAKLTHVGGPERAPHTPHAPRPGGAVALASVNHIRAPSWPPHPPRSAPRRS